MKEHMTKIAFILALTLIVAYSNIITSWLVGELLQL